MSLTLSDLKVFQSMRTDTKILYAQQKIVEWYEHHNGAVYVSFSGGMDSCALLHIVREMYPEVPAVFVDTGLEYPEIREFVKTFDNVAWMHPKMDFKKVLDTYGYPVVSKEVAFFLRQARAPLTEKNQKTHNLRINGIRSDGQKVSVGQIPQCWKFLLHAPFDISEQCCDVMKKRPIHQYEKEAKRKPYVGLLAEESELRKRTWVKKGCNSFEGTTPMSAPLSIWTRHDVLSYVNSNNLSFCSVYGEIRTDLCKRFVTTGAQRTGCVFCAFGIANDNPHKNRFQSLHDTHPKLWEYCMTQLKMKEVLKFMKIPCVPFDKGFDL